jgi:hypothetical protein
VCAVTHGAILFAADGGLETAAPCWLPTAREEAIAPTAATTTATKNSEQKIRRHFDGVNVEFGFVIIELPVRLIWLLVNVNGRRDHACSQSADVCQTFSGKSAF